MRLKTSSKPVIFMDRDGVINVDRADYVKNWDEFTFMPHILDLFSLLHKNDFRVIVITNQSMIGRGIASLDTLQYMHKRMQEEIEKYGGKIEKIYFCPHHPDDNCQCRKPKPGMLLQASEQLGIALGNSIFIGDSLRDIEAGARAGCKTCLLLNDRVNLKTAPIHPDFCIDSIMQVEKIILY